LGVIDISVGIEDQDQKERKAENSMFLYPNPASSRVNIIYDVDEGAVLRIHNLQGKLIDSSALDPGPGQYQWDSSNIEPGTYLISLQAINNRIVAREKVLIVK
jgi:hypothetical protein